MYERVSRIKVRNVNKEKYKDGTPIIAFDDSQFMSRRVQDDKELYDSLQEHLTEHEEDAISNIHTRLDTLEANVIMYFRTTPHDYHAKGELPPRLRQHKNEIDAITGDFLCHIDRIFSDTLCLNSQSSKAKDLAKRHRDITKRRRFDPTNAAQGSTAKCISKAIARVKATHAHISKLLRTIRLQQPTVDINDNDTGHQYLALRDFSPDIGNQLRTLHDQCQDVLDIIESTWLKALADMEEFTAHIEAVDAHRPTDKHSRERERFCLKGNIPCDDWSSLQRIIHQAGCPDILDDEDAHPIGKVNTEEHDWKLWIGPKLNELDTNNPPDYSNSPSNGFPIRS